MYLGLVDYSNIDGNFCKAHMHTTAVPGDSIDAGVFKTSRRCIAYMRNFPQMCKRTTMPTKEREATKTVVGPT